MTDEEIIKALERCVHRGNKNYNTDIVLDLIDSQKAEIERLQKEVNLVSILFQDLQERYEDAQSEARKEFAERLKKDVFNTEYHIDRYYRRTIDNLLKEMEGD